MHTTHFCQQNSVSKQQLAKDGNMEACHSGNNQHVSKKPSPLFRKEKNQTWQNAQDRLV